MRTNNCTPTGDRVDAVLFDLDGTLLDTTEAILSSLKHTVKYFTGREPNLIELRPYMGLPLTVIFSGLVPDHVEEACDVYVRHNLAVHKDLVRLYPGVREVLAALREQDIKIAVVTSKRRATVEVGFKLTGVDGAFDAVVCHDDVTRPKPDPEPVLKALELLHVDTSGSRRVLVVGDSPWDVRAGKNAAAALPGLSIKTAAVTYGATAEDILEKENPDYVLRAIGEVLPICSSGW